MTKQETAKILAVITEVYPAFAKDRNLENTVEIWARFFEDEPYKAVEAAVMQYVAADLKGFAPSIGQIKAAVHTVAGAEEMSEVQAWGLVAKACRNSLYNSESEFAKLPPVIQEVVGSPSVLKLWSMSEPEEFNTVISSNFMRSYRVRAAHAKERAMLPESIQAMLPALRGSIGHPEFFAIPAPKEEPDCLPEAETGTPMPDFFRKAMEAARGLVKE